MDILKKNLVFIVYFIFIIIASFVARELEAIPFLVGIVVFHYLIPGIALQKLSGFLENEEYNKIILSSFAIGYVISVVIYVTLLMLGLQIITFPVSICITIASLFYIRRDIPLLLKRVDSNTGFLATILVICLSIAFLCFQLRNLSPAIVGYTNMHMDIIYWFRNASAATISYPLPDLSVMGKDFYYHYFSSLGIADLFFVSGIDLYNLCFSFSYLINIPILVGATYLLCSDYINRKFFLYLSILLVLFGTTFEDLTYTYYLHHLYYSPFGFTEGFSLSLFSFYYYRKICEFSLRKLFLPIIVFVVAIGSKAPVALIILVGILFCCVQKLYLANMKKKINIIAIGSIYIVSFVAIMSLFIVDLDPEFEGAGNGSLAISMRTAFVPPFFHHIFKTLSHTMLFVPFSAILVFLSYILINSFSFITGGILIARRWNEIEWKHTELSLFIMYLTGYILFLFLHHSGFSQVYFYFAALPFGYLYIISILDKNDFKLNLWEKRMLIVSILISVFCVVFSVSKAIFPLVKNTLNLSSHEIYNKVTGSSLTFKEKEAMDWLRNSLPKESILISNKVIADSGNRSFIVSSYSGLQTYLEGYEYSASKDDKVIRHRWETMKSFFYGDKESLSILKKEGVTHVVLFKNIPDAFPPVDGNIVFDNSAVVVYQIR